MADNPTKYNATVAWRTYALKVSQIRRETVDLVAKYRVYVKPIDSNELKPGESAAGYVFTDNLGNPYKIGAIGVGYVDVVDDFRTHYAPVSGKIGIVHKTAYKGYSLYLPASSFRFLHPLAAQNNNSYAMAILWGNDPNPRRIAFTNILQPGIADYTANLTDMDGIEFNPEEDYGQNPVFEVWQKTSDTTYSRLPIDPQITFGPDGRIQSVLFSGTGELITGYIIIKR